ncbi:MAG TPA: cache domain-containing protein [Ktedonobacteraceae bacterium]
MDQNKPVFTARRKVSLTVRASSLLVLAAVLPLLITVLGSELILRPTLLSQASTQMESNAQAHAQTIDAYMVARLQELEFLGQFFAIQKFLSGEKAFADQAKSELSLGYHLDPDYTTWTLFDMEGNLRAAYPTLPKMRGHYNIIPEALQQLQKENQIFLSNVYFDEVAGKAFIDIYTSIAGTNGQPVGIARATLDLDTIWTTVNDETNAGPGTYAMILDSHGVRIAYTNPDSTLTTQPPGLFKAIASLSTSFQNTIQDEDLYGNAHSAVKVLADPALADAQQNSQGATTFQMTPSLQHEPFQVARASCHILAWTYLVLRPVSTITAPADQQQWYLILLAGLVIILAALIGLLVGRGMTRPLLSSVISLRESSTALKTLATSEHTSAKEQKWMIEASQTGLLSVQYYTDATRIAAHRLDEIGNHMLQQAEYESSQENRQVLATIISVARYIERATNYQQKSCHTLATAIRVTSQVTEQLIKGANSATESSEQLDQVVEQLREVVGK